MIGNVRDGVDEASFAGQLTLSSIWKTHVSSDVTVDVTVILSEVRVFLLLDRPVYHKNIVFLLKSKMRHRFLSKSIGCRIRRVSRRIA